MFECGVCMLRAYKQDVNTKIRETREHFQSFNDASCETQYFITSIKAGQQMSFWAIY